MRNSQGRHHCVKWCIFECELYGYVVNFQGLFIAFTYCDEHATLLYACYGVSRV